MWYKFGFWVIKNILIPVIFIINKLIIIKFNGMINK